MREKGAAAEWQRPLFVWVFELRPLFVGRNEERDLLFLEKVAKSRRPGSLRRNPFDASLLEREGAKET